MNMDRTKADIRIDRVDDDVYRATSLQFGGLTAEGSTAAEAERLLLELLAQRGEVFAGMRHTDLLVDADEVADEDEA